MTIRKQHILEAVQHCPPQPDVWELIRAADALEAMFQVGGGFVCHAGLRDLVEHEVRHSIEACEELYKPGIGLMDEIYRLRAPKFYEYTEAARRRGKHDVELSLEDLRKEKRRAAA